MKLKKEKKRYDSKYPAYNYSGHILVRKELWLNSQAKEYLLSFLCAEKCERQKEKLKSKILLWKIRIFVMLTGHKGRQPKEIFQIAFLLYLS